MSEQMEQKQMRYEVRDGLLRLVLGDEEIAFRCAYGRGVGHSDLIKEAEEHYRRIVACVNACAGISTETLEKIATGAPISYVALKAERDDLERQRNALYEIAERCLEVFDGAPFTFSRDNVETIARLRDVIALIESTKGK